MDLTNNSLFHLYWRPLSYRYLLARQNFYNTECAFDTERELSSNVSSNDLPFNSEYVSVSVHVIDDVSLPSLLPILMRPENMDRIRICMITLLTYLFVD